MLDLEGALAGLNQYPNLQSLVGVTVLALIALIVNWLTKHVLLRIVRKALNLL